MRFTSLSRAFLRGDHAAAHGQIADAEMILPTILVENARTQGRRPAVLDGDGILTWGDFSNRVARAAGLLRALGLRRGERFAVLMRNSFRQAELLWAGYWSGIVPVPVNWRLSPGEIADILEDAECRLIAVEEEFLPMLESPALAQPSRWPGVARAVGVRPPWAAVPGGGAAWSLAGSGPQPASRAQCPRSGSRSGPRRFAGPCRALCSSGRGPWSQTQSARTRLWRFRGPEGVSSIGF